MKIEKQNKFNYHEFSKIWFPPCSVNFFSTTYVKLTFINGKKRYLLLKFVYKILFTLENLKSTAKFILHWKSAFQIRFLTIYHKIKSRLCGVWRLHCIIRGRVVSKVQFWEKRIKRITFGHQDFQSVARQLLLCCLTL